MKQGTAARAAGDHEAALALFRDALQQRPREAWALMSVADTLRDLNRHDEADEACRAMLAEHPGHPGALVALGRSLRRRGDAAGALPLFQAALERKPPAPWVRTALADALRDLGRHDEADEACRAVLEDDPGHVGALVALGHTANARADRAAAAAWFDRAAQARPDAPGPRLALADALRNLGDLGAATEAAKAVLARDPGHVEGWISLGHTERRAGRRDAALRAFARASEQKPDSPRPLVEMAIEERRLGRPEASERLLFRALELDGDSAETLQRLGEHFRLADKRGEALDMFRRAMATSRPSAWAYVAAGQTLVELGELDAALRTLDEGEARLGAKPEFAAKRSELFRRTGDWPGALAVVERAGRTWPRHFGIWFERASLERLRGGPGDFAERIGEAPVGNTFDRARVHLLLGLEAADRWRFDEAQENYARSIELNEDDGWPRICLAQTRLLALDIEGAREQLRAVSRLDSSAAKLQGRSSNISQTHLGQLLDEFVLDRQALDGLLALKGLAPEERVAPLLSLVARFPDYTPAAIALFTALRQSGRLGTRPAAAAPARIPRVFAQYWDDDAGPPPDLARVMGSWGKLYPRYDLRRFDDARARAFLVRFHPAEVQAAYRRSRQPAQKADIFRLAYLYSQGGYYADADDRLVGDLEDLRFPGAGLVLYQEDIGTIGNNLIGAVPGHPLIGRALRSAVEAINRGDNDILWLSTGPGMLTRAFAGLLADHGREPLAALDDAVVLEHGELQRTVSIHCLVGYKNTERHWSRTAFARRVAAAA
ncbi:tetratricopeptide repeat protein, partial [Craurococcus roseus]